jgi:hypothetical protein
MVRKKEINKKGQLAIFIILAIAIVIILLFLFVGRDRLFSVFVPESPINQIKKCAQEPVQEAVDILKVQGGSLEPELYYLYQGNKVEYLCYVNGYYQDCIMQKPLLKQSIEKEIREYAEPRIKDCMYSIKTSLENKGYYVIMDIKEISFSLVPNNIIIDIDTDLSISKESTESYKSIKTDISSKLYDMIMLASSISNWEARYGDAETMTYMMYYPSLKLEKKKQGDGTTIYILTNRNNPEDKFIFASRSLVLPSGLTGM